MKKPQGVLLKKGWKKFIKKLTGEEYTAAAVFQVSTTDAGASGMKLEVLSGTQQVETINLQ